MFDTFCVQSRTPSTNAEPTCRVAAPTLSTPKPTLLGIPLSHIHPFLTLPPLYPNEGCNPPLSTLYPRKTPLYEPPSEPPARRLCTSLPRNPPQDASVRASLGTSCACAASKESPSRKTRERPRESVIRSSFRDARSRPGDSVRPEKTLHRDVCFRCELLRQECLQQPRYLVREDSSLLPRPQK
eukprot:1195901-Prorocentrum_minimum.AAC.8